MPVLEVKNLSKSFKRINPKKKKNQENKSFKILHDLNFQVEKGESFVIIGPNGSGKTTLLRILGLLEEADNGQILLNGKDILGQPNKKRFYFRRQLSFVRQKPRVLNDTVWKNIAYPLRFRGEDEKIINRKVDKIIQKVDLEHLKDKNARLLSGGEMQRVAIAMNFIADPDIYILDEISANLDLKNQIILEQFINEIRKNKEKTLILSTHDPFEAIKYADRIAVLSDSRIIQVGSPKEIFSKPNDEFTAQFVGYQNVFDGIGKFDENMKITNIKINDLTIASSTKKDGPLKACIRPESILISKHSMGETSLRNNLKGKIEEIIDLGNICHIYISAKNEVFLISITLKSKKAMNLKTGTSIFFSFKATDVLLL